MRKRLIALSLAIIIVLTFVLSACGPTGMFRKNEERDAKQITAVATYNERVSLIEKSELVSSFNEYLNNMVMYYRNGYITYAQFQEVIDKMGENFGYANESLGKSSLFTLYCIDYMANYYEDNDIAKYAQIVQASTKGKTYDLKDISSLERYRQDRIAEIEAILTTEQINDVRKLINESFESQLEALIKEINEEIALAKRIPDQVLPEGIKSIKVTAPRKLTYEVGEELNTSGLVVEAEYEDADAVVIEKGYKVTGFSSEKVAKSQEVTVTYGDFSDKFEVTIVVARPTRTQAEKEEEEEEEEEEYPTDDEGKILLIDKYSFSPNEADYDTKEELNVAKEGIRRIKLNLKNSFRDYDYYYLKQLESKIVKVTEETLHNSIVLTKADIDEFYNKMVQTEKEAYQSTEYSAKTLENAPFNTIVHGKTEEKGFFYVKHILFKFEADQEKAISRFVEEKSGNEDALQALRESYANLIGVWLSNPEYDEEAVCEDEDCACSYCDNYKGEDNYGENHNEDCECVACPTQKYLNDTAINVLQIIDDINADLNAIKNSVSYADNYEKHRALMEKFDEWIYKANEDDGMFKTLSEKGLGYLVPPTGDSGYVKEFERLSRELAQEGLGASGWCVTEFGIHYIIVTGYASDVEPSEDYRYLPYDYVVNTLTYEINTEGEEYKVYDGDSSYYVKTGTIEQYIYDAILSIQKANMFAAFQKEFFNEHTETGVEYFPKTYKSTVKEIQSSLKK